MFEHRLGALLHKSIAEVRELSAVEYHRWELFYQIEPWGTEYIISRLIAGMFNGSGRFKTYQEPEKFVRKLNFRVDEKSIGMTKEELKQYRKEHRDEIRMAVKSAFGVK